MPDYRGWGCLLVAAGSGISSAGVRPKAGSVTGLKPIVAWHDKRRLRFSAVFSPLQTMQSLGMRHLSFFSLPTTCHVISALFSQQFTCQRHV
jgi:hypothetical protein